MINSTSAFVLKQKGNANQAFELKEINIPKLDSEEVLIQVNAFGLNYADVMARNGLYKEAPPMPCVIGYEVTGEIISVGKNVHKEWIGKRVVGFTRFGGYAKHAISTINGIALINEISDEEALALCTQGVTAYYMTNYFQHLQKGDYALIHAAAGGVGTMLIQLLKLKGINVIAKVSSKQKEELAQKVGADFTINYIENDYTEKCEYILNGAKINAIYNAVGGSTFKKDLKLLNQGGALYLFGGAELSGGKFGVLSAINFLIKMGIVLPIGLMMQSKSIIGVNMLKIGDNQPQIILNCLNNCIRLFQEGKIKPQIGGVFSANELGRAHDFLESGKSIGKLVIKW